MSRIIKITTSCNFVGSETVHFIEVKSNITEDEMSELVEQYVEDDIRPEGSWEYSSKEEIEEFGSELE